MLCLNDLLKYFVIFLVASNNSAMWSGLLVEMESCKWWFSVVIYFISVTVFIAMNVIRALLFVKGMFSRVFRWCMVV